MYTAVTRSLCYDLSASRNNSLRFALLSRKSRHYSRTPAAHFSPRIERQSSAQTSQQNHHDDTQRCNSHEAHTSSSGENGSSQNQSETHAATAERNRFTHQDRGLRNLAEHNGPPVREFRSLAEFLGHQHDVAHVVRFGGSDERPDLPQRSRENPDLRHHNPEVVEHTAAQCPDWFLQNNVVLAEDAAVALRSGAPKLVQGDKEDVPIAEGHAGLRDLLTKYREKNDLKEHEEYLDDKIGPFAVSSMPRDDLEDEERPSHAFISLSHYLEIALSVATGLAPVQSAEMWNNNRQRTFLSLYAPEDGSTEILNQVVQHVAKSQNADVIHLSAMDLADLSSELPNWKSDPFLSTVSDISYHTHKAFAGSTKDETEKDNEDEDEGMEGQIAVHMPFAQILGVQNSRKDAKDAGRFMPHHRPFLKGSTLKDLEIIIDAATQKRWPAKEHDNESSTKHPSSRVILCISDFAELSSHPPGAMILKALEDMVQSRRTEEKQEIMIIGTSHFSDMDNEDIMDVQESLEDGSESTFYRTLIVPPFQEARIVDAVAEIPTFTEVDHEGAEPFEVPVSSEISDSHSAAQAKSDAVDDVVEARDVQLESLEIWDGAESSKTLLINSRHIRSMTAQIQGEPQTLALEIPLRLDDDVLVQHDLNFRVLNLTEVHRTAVLTAGIQHIKVSKEAVTPDDVALAMSLMHSNFLTTIRSPTEEVEEDIETLALNPRRIVHDMDDIKSKCNKLEKRLLHCMISTDQLRTTFTQVHTKPETVDALRTLTSMSLLRPDSFAYGVLKSESIPGVLLYGPPGTGKTLLAKAVAKESGATMLVISASEVNHKYVGESEKTVRAIFSLARKLSPCVVFIDEADSLFQSRGAFHSRAGSHETMNQFLSEIEHFGGSSRDGDRPNVFLMIATNRPFDLDDAILRRVPRRLLVDLPAEKDREEIIKIHLSNEHLESDVSTLELARRTPFYSGSDLKNLCVAAALACVREENAAIKAAREKGDKSAKYPPKRTLRKDHFDIAIGEISASIGDDMSSLNQIRKFDEKYGDRKGRREKSLLGFGQRKITDEMLRVRV